LANAKIMFDKADRKLMVNRMFAVHPIERNHHITLAISFFNDKAFKLHCKDYDK
jgi:beta-xylosidase